VSKKISNKYQNLWVAYELIKDDWIGQATSDQVFEYIAKQNNVSVGTVRKAVEEARKNDQLRYSGIDQPMTKREAAKYLGVSIPTLDRARKAKLLRSQTSDGKIVKGHPSGGKVFFLKEWLDEYKSKK